MIGILGFNDLFLMQYLYKYTSVYDEAGIAYEVVYWNRSNKQEAVGFQGKTIAFDHPMNTYLPFWKKARCFLKYARFLRRQIRAGQYDRLIVLTTQTAVPLYDLLTRKYAGRYLYDYRDITREKDSALFRQMVRSLIRHSHTTAVSSEGFLPELGMRKEDRILPVHNTQKACRRSGFPVRLCAQEPIRIVFWGMVRQVGYNQRICDLFGNDRRFTLVYHGDGYHKALEDYCRAKGYQNISFTGWYPPSSIPEFIQETDILNCLYENDDIQKCAMPVKAYDAIHYRLPVLISAHSFAAGFLSSLHGAFALDAEHTEEVGDRVCAWYRSLKKTEMEASYAALEKQIYEDDLRFSDMAKRFAASFPRCAEASSGANVIGKAGCRS